jgi:hypothetical protein
VIPRDVSGVARKMLSVYYLSPPWGALFIANVSFDLGRFARIGQNWFNK